MFFLVFIYHFSSSIFPHALFTFQTITMICYSHVHCFSLLPPSCILISYNTFLIFYFPPVSLPYVALPVLHYNQQHLPKTITTVTAHTISCLIHTHLYLVPLILTVFIIIIFKFNCRPLLLFFLFSCTSRAPPHASLCGPSDEDQRQNTTTRKPEIRKSYS